MNYLILGCDGMVGHTVGMFLKSIGNNVVGIARRNKCPGIQTIIGDISDSRFVEKIFEEEGIYDCVVNCVGILNKFAEDKKADAVYLNAYIPHKLVDITNNTRTKIIHISTDCVFSGNKGSYSEYDFKDGDSFYDRSKALGEIDDEKNLTLRQSIVGPDMRSDGIGLLNWFMQQSGEIEGFTDVIWTGVTSLELAKIINIVAQDNTHGIVNAVPSRSISKFELLCLFNKYLRNNKIRIIPTNKYISNKSLICTRDKLRENIHDYEDMIHELSVWVKEHNELYPHYEFGG